MSRLLCKCMNADCPNTHASDSPKLNVTFGDEDTATVEETVRVAVQDFTIPTDAIAVRIQVGSMPLTVVGWITSADVLPYLLRDVARENEKALEEWNAATPEGSRVGSVSEETD